VLDIEGNRLLVVRFDREKFPYRIGPDGALKRGTESVAGVSWETDAVETVSGSYGVSAVIPHSAPPIRPAAKFPANRRP